ncbi:MAG: hypothetical protein QM775_29070 [Pirellulales bacterium]
MDEPQFKIDVDSPPKIVVDPTPRAPAENWSYGIWVGVASIAIAGFVGYQNMEEGRERAEQQRRQNLQNDPVVRELLDPTSTAGKSPAGEALRSLLRPAGAEAPASSNQTKPRPGSLGELLERDGSGS